MIIGVTGHRPTRLGLTYHGHGLADYDVLNWFLFKLYHMDVHHVLSGMALGVDQLAVRAAFILDIPYTAVLPFPNQDARWQKQERDRWTWMVENAHDVVVIEDAYSPEAYKLRNKYIVDHCDLLLAAWDGSEKGGTYHTIQYARSTDRGIHFYQKGTYK